MKVVIIGGVAGGITVARRLRRKDKNIEIEIIDRSYHLAPSSCMLPYALEQNFNEDHLHTGNIEEFQEKYNIKVKLMTEVIDINEKNKELKVIETGSGAIYKVNFDKLVISTGTDAIKLKELDNLNNNIFIFKNIKNLQRLKSKLYTEGYKDITVIGAGPLGLEIAEVLHGLGFNLTVIDREKRILPQYNASIAEILEKNIKDKINLLTDSKILSSKLQGDKIELRLNTGTHLTDIVIVTVGNRPNTNFLDNSNIKKDKSGFIYVDEYFKTNNKDIYALGDVILTKEYITKENMVFGTAGVTQRQAKFVADNILSTINKKIIAPPYKGAVKTEIVKIFDYTIGRVGLNEREISTYLKNNNKIVSLEQDIDTVYIEETSNVTSFDYASPIYLVGYFNKKNQELIGVQAVGKYGIDKRLDVAATAIRANMTAEDLINLDLTYSPPYNIPKDILNRLGSLAVKGDN